ncbi:MAG: hypothetical protein K2W96_19570 [Gemmataceae bacterium]|nr:hypothetical protein [Gemmataceae bacterium]
MTKNRSLLLGLAALCCSALLGAWAEDKPGEERDKGKGGAAARGTAFMGRVAKVDADKMTIELRDAKPWRAGGAGGERDKGAGAAADKGRDSDKAGAGDRAGSMTFKVGDRATITLDGKEAKLADLKADAWARIHVGAAGGAGGERDKSSTAADKGREERADRTMTATRVEAFTKDPGAGGGRDSGTKDSKPRE